jgi:GMP reductase
MEEFIAKELDFNDVLILPQPSSLSSRSQVKLERTLEFVNIVDEDNSDDEDYQDTKIHKKWSGIPIIASNMDTTGTFTPLKI